MSETSANARRFRRHENVSTRRWIRDSVRKVIGATRDVTIYYGQKLDVVYVVNAKAANSTILNTIKQVTCERYPVTVVESDPRSEDDAVRLTINRNELSRSVLFSCVRNPYTRALSGYLDKIALPGSKEIRHGYGLDGSTEISFRDFLEKISRFSRLDVHFRPQYLNIGIELFSLDAIFYLEKWSHFESFLGSRSHQHDRHATGAHSRIHEYYDDECIELVRTLYDRDFEEFGYSRDINDVDPRAEAIIAGKFSFDAPPSRTMPQRRQNLERGLSRIILFQNLKGKKLI